MLQRVSDARLSLWQSAVAQMLRTQAPAATSATVVQSHVATHPLMQSVNRHVQAHAAGQPLMLGAEAAPADELAHVSRLKFEIAEATLAGDQVRVQALQAECRKYATCDLAGWATTIETYIAYKSKYAEPLYRDWQQSGQGLNFGVIEYRLPANARVALIGDWATGTPDAKAMVAEIIDVQQPDAIIHLGDIYYSGTPDECTLNVAAVFTEVFEELGKPRVPVFMIPGNHDYYAYGAGFYALIDEIHAEPSWRQQASYFCLRTVDDAWQFLGMDTGRQDYNPLNDFDPWYDGPSLQPSEITWHRDKLNHAKFAGATILLSHHQLFSQHSKISNKTRGWLNEHLLEIFQPSLSHVAAWFWGHEHNLVLFQDGLYDVAKPRLVGCSGYEEKVSEDPYAQHSDDFAANVPYREPRIELERTGEYFPHAYAMIELGETAKVTYIQFPSWGKETPVNKPEGKAIGSENVPKPAPAPPPGIPIKFGDTVFLQHSKGNYVIGFHAGTQNYPRLGNTGAVALQITGGIDVVRNGAEIQIKSTEEALGGYNYLGAWSLSHDVYYYTKDYDVKKQTWRIIKKSDLDDSAVHYGDEVYITNQSFANQRLARDGEYITTAQAADDFWVVLAQAPVMREPAGTAARQMPSPMVPAGN